MDISGLFSGFANNLLQHYQQLIDDIKSNHTPRHYTQSAPENTLPGEVSDTNVPLTEDSYDPGIQPANPDYVNEGSLTPTDNNDEEVKTPVNSDSYIPSEEGQENSQGLPESPGLTDGTYNFKSLSKLNYKLDLSFDMAAISRTVRYLSEGDVQQVEQLSAAGFGLSADFALTGHQVTKTSLENTEGNNRMADHTRGRNFNRMNRAGAFMANSRDFKVQSFYKEASRIRNSFDVMNHNGHSRTVNKLAMRYRLDSSFSFANLERFNVQTQQVADKTPESLRAYFDNTGGLAESGSNNLMETFFDAVDSYLSETENNLLDKTVAFFEQAAKELGFSEPMIAMAKDHLMSTIEGFFDRVDTALNSMESQFVPEQIQSEPIVPEPQVSGPDESELEITKPEAIEIPVVETDKDANSDPGKSETTATMAMA